MKITSKVRATARAALVALLLAPAAGCAGSADDGPVELRFWSWVPGADKAVDRFNSTHRDIKVTLDNIPPGNEGGYAKMHAAVKAGNAPCLAQVEFQEVPSFLLDRELVDLGPFLTQADRAAFQPLTWELVSFEGGTYAIPQATGPMGLYYRADLFAKWGIKAPATWQEYAAAAERIHRASPGSYITNFASNDLAWFIGLAWQAGARWFRTDGGVWYSQIARGRSLMVARYWDDLIRRGLVKPAPLFTPSWYKDLADGTLVALPLPHWSQAILEANAAGTAGKWRLAPMPRWSAGDRTSANYGGSTTAVLDGCDRPREAVEFALWLNRDPASIGLLIKGGYGWPATAGGASHPELTAPAAFLGGQRTDAVFTRSAAEVPTGWRWWPTFQDTVKLLSDRISGLSSGGATIAGALRETERRTIDEINAKGLTAREAGS